MHGKFLNIVDELADEGDVDLDRSWQEVSLQRHLKAILWLHKSKPCQLDGENQP